MTWSKVAEHNLFMPSGGGGGAGGLGEGGILQTPSAENQAPKASMSTLDPVAA